MSSWPCWNKQSIKWQKLTENKEIHSGISPTARAVLCDCDSILKLKLFLGPAALHWWDQLEHNRLASFSTLNYQRRNTQIKRTFNISNYFNSSSGKKCWNLRHMMNESIIWRCPMPVEPHKITAPLSFSIMWLATPRVVPGHSCNLDTSSPFHGILVFGSDLCRDGYCLCSISSANTNIEFMMFLDDKTNKKDKLRHCQ